MRGAWGPGIRLPRSLLRACPGDLRGASGPEDRLVFSLSRASSRLSLPASGSECNSSAETPSCGLRAIELCASSSMSVPGWVRYGSRAWAGLVQRGSGVCFAAGTSRGKTPRCAPKPPQSCDRWLRPAFPRSCQTGPGFPSLPFPSPQPPKHILMIWDRREIGFKFCKREIALPCKHAPDPLLRDASFFFSLRQTCRRGVALEC